MKMIGWKKLDKVKKAALLKYAVIFAFPFLLCFLYCVFRGINIFQLYLPNSHNNDSLFYYKLVEGILSDGIPRGFYGFNESRALVGSFAAWSPALLLPWTIWGFLFGWGYSSVFISNIVYFAIALTVFVHLTKMEWRNILFMFGVLVLYPSLPIHLLSALPEVVVASVMLLFFGFAIRAVRDEYPLWCTIPMFVCSIYLTVCRPYMVILVLLPCYYLIKAKVKGAYLYAGALLVLGIVLYYLCNHFLTSAYFSPLFDVSAVKALLKGNLSEAFWLCVIYIKNMAVDVGRFISGAFSYGLTAGTQYVVAAIVAIALSVFCFSKKEKEQRPANIVFTITLWSVFAAIFLLLQKANEGGRHVWGFTIVGCILIFCNKWSKKTVIFGTWLVGILGVFLVQGSMIPTDYDVPVMDEALKSDVEYWERTLEEKNISAGEQLSYDNTCVWVLTDGDRITNHKELYALPEGMGISCCFADYVTENLDVLKSGYIATVAGGDIDILCEQRGWTEIGRTENVVVYQSH